MDATSTQSATRRALRWLGSRRLELFIFLVGVLLRVSMTWNYPASWSYDAQWHWEVVQWIFDHHRVPPPTVVLEAQHPPLYYTLAAVLLGLGVSQAKAVVVSVIFGTLRLAMIWAGLELYIPESRWARASGLALAAVIAASVHIDGMVYPEAMSNMWVAAALLVTPLAFQREGRKRYQFALLSGLILGLSMLTKISAVVVIASVLATAGIELLWSRATLRKRLENGAAWALMLGVCVSVCGWYFYRNLREFHTPFVTSFDLPSQHWLVEATDKISYLDRRTLGYFFGWGKGVYEFPYYPTDITPRPRFWPVAVASTFVDFWNYGFSGWPSGSHPWGADYYAKTIHAAQRSAAGGTLIFAATVAAFLGAGRWLLQRRDWARLFLLITPLVALLSAMHFAVTYPVDTYGVVKGIYLTFAAPPLYGLFGVAVDWCRRSPNRWPLLGALLGALWLVATYTVYSRLRLPLLPL